MALRFKKYVAVGFFSKQEAQQAMSAALEHFRKGRANCDNLSRCEGNIVYFQLDSKSERASIKTFLLNQPGAQPEGSLCNF